MKILLLCTEYSESASVRDVIAEGAAAALPRLICDCQTVSSLGRIDSVHAEYDCILVSDRFPALELDSFIRRFARRFPLLLLSEHELNAGTSRYYAIGLQDVLSLQELQPACLRRSINAAVARKRAVNRETERAAIASLAGDIKSIFMSLISHELRTPLNGISLSAEILSTTELDAEQKDLVGSINSCTFHLTQLIGQILEFTLLERERLSRLEHEFCLSSYLAGISDRIRRLCDSKSIDFRVHIDPAVPDTLIADCHKIEQVLLNLLSNAVRFTPEGGAIALEIVALEEKEDSQLLQCTITDTGCGISEDTQEILFELFAKSCTIQSYEASPGIGLGLPIAGKLVSILGGTIWVDSSVGEGSSFHFTVPVRRSGVTSRSASAALRSDGLLQQSEVLSGKKILVIEDSLVHQRLISSLLRRWGCYVVSVRNAIDAEIAALNSSLDAVLVDLSENKAAGLAFADRVRSPDWSSQGSPPVLVAVTSTFSETDVIESESSCFDGYIGRPYRSKELFQVLSGCLRTPGTGGE